MTPIVERIIRWFSHSLRSYAEARVVSPALTIQTIPDAGIPSCPDIFPGIPDLEGSPIIEPKRLKETDCPRCDRIAYINSYNTLTCRSCNLTARGWVE